nr:unnamed protein product [Callosobruchus analis]
MDNIQFAPFIAIRKLHPWVLNGKNGNAASRYF